MTLGILTALWGRPALSRRVLDYYGSIEVPGCRCVRLAVSSPLDASPTGVPATWGNLEAPNAPLGRKWNLGLQALAPSCDAVMFVGSDDLVSPSWIEYVVDKLERGADYVRAVGCYRWTAERPGHVAMLPYFTPGAGRVLSRRALSLLKGRPYDGDAPRKIDASMDKRVGALGNLRRHNARMLVDPKAFAILGIQHDTTHMWALEPDGSAQVSSADGERLKTRGVVYIPLQRFNSQHFPAHALEELTRPQ